MPFLWKLAILARFGRSRRGYGRGRGVMAGAFGPAWEARFQVVVDRIRPHHAPARGLLHVLVEGQIAHQVIGVRQHDRVVQPFAQRREFAPPIHSPCAA